MVVEILDWPRCIILGTPADFFVFSFDRTAGRSNLESWPRPGIHIMNGIKCWIDVIGPITSSWHDICHSNGLRINQQAPLLRQFSRDVWRNCGAGHVDHTWSETIPVQGLKLPRAETKRQLVTTSHVVVYYIYNIYIYHILSSILS